MFDTLDKRERTALEKDPNNPNASLASSQNSTASFSKSVGAGAARNALKEKIAEQRRAKLAAAKGVPDRPKLCCSKLCTSEVTVNQVACLEISFQCFVVYLVGTSSTTFRHVWRGYQVSAQKSLKHGFPIGGKCSTPHEAT